MKNPIALSCWLILAFTLIAPATLPQQLPERFVIDQSKPFAYIKFDHVADRKQPSPEESPKGLWLRLVNNSRVPIAVLANGPEPGELGVTIEYDVVQISLLGVPHLIRAPDPFGSSPPSQAENATPSATANPPKGYSIEVGSGLTIPPGGSLLLSVPLNAVSASWYLQVPFHFQLPRARTVQAPLILVNFGWQDLPKQYRGGSNR
jgi:hypothetical protein